jgi:hypothetical protein
MLNEKNSFLQLWIQDVYLAKEQLHHFKLFSHARLKFERNKIL